MDITKHINRITTQNADWEAAILGHISEDTRPVNVMPVGTTEVSDMSDVSYFDHLCNFGTDTEGELAC